MQLVASAGHPDVEQPPLLGHVRVGRQGQGVAHELVGHLERVAPVAAWESVRHQADEEDDVELEALGLVIRQDVDRVAVVRPGVDVRGRGVVAGLDERVELLDEERQPVVAKQASLPPHDLEEAPDVRQPLLARLASLVRQAPQPAGRGDEVVQQLAAGALGAHGPMRVKASQQLLHDLERAERERRVLRVLRRIPQRDHQWASSPSGAVQRHCHVAGREAEDLGRREVIEADRVLRVVDGTEERDEDPHLRLPVEAGRAAEAPCDAGHVQRADVRIGVAVAAHEDRVLPRAPTRTDGGSDAVGDRIGLVRARRVAGKPDGALRRLRPGELRPRAQPLVEPLARLQSVRIVVADEPMRRVQDRLPAAVVVNQQDARRAGVRGAEAEDVAEGGAAEAVDRLVVVPDHGDVAVLSGQQPYELPLRVVRVLELVDQDVPIPPTLLVEHRGVLPQEAEREAHLVAEVESI